ncbi:hypothetical protein CXG81DRAFT_24610 [Caulochytrium protostelioides]|uniref:Uncharacterized protein n=1 Tax=Caulochytrium protostelioides TaxID=1555241 RepID=A0A4P9XC46_9FUNG|nr:hypothetical protein CXG81DRAFT_24610 [Caulochytrium protostelioides]|eukprot:RKP02730.1 hypothetical protein CXG81DRAFT_24610 [Caulochytrium protostelioides]
MSMERRRSSHMHDVGRLDLAPDQTAEYASRTSLAASNLSAHADDAGPFSTEPWPQSFASLPDSGSSGQPRAPRLPDPGGAEDPAARAAPRRSLPWPCDETPSPFRQGTPPRPLSSSSPPPRGPAAFEQDDPSWRPWTYATGSSSRSVAVSVLSGHSAASDAHTAAAPIPASRHRLYLDDLADATPRTRPHRARTAGDATAVPSLPATTGATPSLASLASLPSLASRDPSIAAFQEHLSHSHMTHHAPASLRLSVMSEQAALALQKDMTQISRDLRKQKDALAARERALAQREAALDREQVRHQQEVADRAARSASTQRTRQADAAAMAQLQQSLQAAEQDAKHHANSLASSIKANQALKAKLAAREADAAALAEQHVALTNDVRAWKTRAQRDKTALAAANAAADQLRQQLAEAEARCATLQAQQDASAAAAAAQRSVASLPSLETMWMTPLVEYLLGMHQLALGPVPRPGNIAGSFGDSSSSVLDAPLRSHQWVYAERVVGVLAATLAHTRAAPRQLATVAAPTTWINFALYWINAGVPNADRLAAECRAYLLPPRGDQPAAPEPSPSPSRGSRPSRGHRREDSAAALGFDADHVDRLARTLDARAVVGLAAAGTVGLSDPDALSALIRVVRRYTDDHPELSGWMVRQGVIAVLAPTLTRHARTHDRVGEEVADLLLAYARNAQSREFLSACHHSAVTTAFLAALSCDAASLVARVLQVLRHLCQWEPDFLVDHPPLLHHVRLLRERHHPPPDPPRGPSARRADGDDSDVRGQLEPLAAFLGAGNPV